jgi:hypothetical protein
MNIASKMASALLAAFFTFNGSIQQTASKPTGASQCPSPFPSTYKSSKKTKYVDIPDLGIAVKTSVSDRLVYIKSEARFTFMTPPEYKSYQCSRTKKVSYTSFYPYGYHLAYEVIENPTRQPLAMVLKEKYKAEINVDLLGKVKINNIEFLTTPKAQGDPVSAWFIPKSKPGIVVQYSSYCDCGAEYSDLIGDLNGIKNSIK